MHSIDTALIEEKIRASFTPYHCLTKIEDYGWRLKFKVFDDSRRILGEWEDIDINELRDESDLAILIRFARSQLRERSFKLS